MIKITIDGFDDVLQEFQNAPIQILKETEKALAKSATTIESNLVKELKRKRINDTGKLSQSITISKPRPLAVLIEVKSKYGRFVEDGTKPHPVAPDEVVPEESEVPRSARIIFLM